MDSAYADSAQIATAVGPVVSVIMPFVLAFGPWPVQRELEELRWRLQQGPVGVSEP